MPKNPDVVDGMRRDERRRRARKVRDQTKRNREKRPPRRNDWTDLAYVDWDEVDEDAYLDERIMPRDEGDRRRLLEELLESGREPSADAASEPAADGTTGRVVAVTTNQCRVQLSDERIDCTMRGSLSAVETGFTNVVAVGDWVEVTCTEAGHGVVEKVLPARNRIARTDPFRSHLRHVIAANVDQLLIVASWRDPHLWPELIDRYLIAAQASEIKPLIAVNKVDLASSPTDVEEAIRPYMELGYDVLLTSAVSRQGVEALSGALAGCTSALAGLSGVGKSSLLAAIEPGFELRTGEVNVETHQGRHTTTQVTMLKLGTDGWVIDTPGIKEFGLAGLRRRDLIEYYPDLRQYAGQCRFKDCSHRHEPDCAVREAVTAGAIVEWRYEDYLAIARTLPE